jgi:hypothetical protein
MERGYVFAFGSLFLSVVLYVTHLVLADNAVPISAYAPYFTFFVAYLLFVIILPPEKNVFSIQPKM